MNDGVLLHSPGRIVDVGIDWLTATATRPRSRERLREVAETLQSDLLRDGYEAAQWHWNGYAGHCHEGFAWGERDDSVICRISGPFASRWWFLPAYVADRCTRIDLQVTVDQLPAGVDLTAAAQEQVSQAPRGKGKPLKWQRIVTADDGATLYLGSRASERTYRLYDKGAEETGKHLTGKWRYECELKEATGSVVAKTLVPSAHDVKLIAGFVRSAFANRGVTPWFDVAHCPDDITPDRPKRSIERTLGWLKRDVSKTLERLRRNGLEVEAIDALRLSRPAVQQFLTTGTTNGVHPQNSPSRS
jgi:DNA relaxase NicK